MLLAVYGLHACYPTATRREPPSRLYVSDTESGPILTAFLQLGGQRAGRCAGALHSLTTG